MSDEKTPSNTAPSNTASSDTAPSNFVRNLIEADLAAVDLVVAGHGGEPAAAGRVVTRFPPEPNGYLHIGHAKSICLNFGLAEDYHGRCHLRFDDTNPLTEESEYLESIQEDVRWLGYDWGANLFHVSDYFEQLYEFAVQLIRASKAYVCDLSAAEVRESRGTLTEPGQDSPGRTRSVEENLELFARMRAGEFPAGARTLRAKIDMAAPNLNLRDPVLYRVRQVPHYRTGDSWAIYPSYDWAHGQSDYIEGITHSLCTLEFEDHRPLYDWFLEQLGAHPKPRQIEFARLNLAYTVTSKRLLQSLVREGVVCGWDDPRMPTLAGLRRRGVRPGAVRQFCASIGVARADSLVDIALLESCIRKDLEPETPRVMCVHEPLRLVLSNWPAGKVLELEASYLPGDPQRYGSRKVPFGGELYIEREDFMEHPPKDFFRLAPGREVRLRRSYVIRCEEVLKDARGHITEVRCRYDPETLNAKPRGRKVKGTVHWVSAAHALPVEVRLYDRLFTVPNPAAVKGGDYREHLNPDSLRVLSGALAEPALAAARPGERYQFERKGFYVVDAGASAAGSTEDTAGGALAGSTAGSAAGSAAVGPQAGRLVFNRIVTLRDTWAKLNQAEGGAGQSPQPLDPSPSLPTKPGQARTGT